MASVLEEKLREAACVGDLEAVERLLNQNVDLNSKNGINGWTALHWACKRGNEEVTKLLLNHGANPKVENFKGEIPAQICSNPSIFSLLGETSSNVTTPPSAEESGVKFIPNYLRNPPLNPQVDIGSRVIRPRPPDFSVMPTTTLPSQFDDLVLKVRVAGSNDPDFIEVEIPRWKLTYANLLRICCEEWEIQEGQVERIRKMPNTRLRKDSDVKRLVAFQCLELVMKSPRDKYNNGYQSISNCKDQTVLY